jgi:hypothetical protein
MANNHTALARQEAKRIESINTLLHLRREARDEVTELEEAELTDGQGRALSAHKTQESYVRYAKRTEKRMLSATRKRHAHLLANKLVEERENETSTSVRNGQQNLGRNDHPEQRTINE